MTKSVETYSFDDWDEERWAEARAVFQSLEHRRTGESKMRDMLLKLYFRDMGVEE